MRLRLLLRGLRSFLNKQALVTGFQPEVLVRSLLAIPTYARDMRAYQKMNNMTSFQIRMRDVLPILTDMKSDAGTTGGHYFHQDLWAARKIFAEHPAEHFDIGSRVDGFIAHLLAFMPVTVVDIRPLTSDIAGLTFFQDDASALRNVADNSIRSLSTLHTAEHFGLGRYTDPVDPLACFKFMASLQRVLAPGGKLYFSVPVGRERVEFNAHRVFDPSTILRSFSVLELVSFSFVGDDGLLYEDHDPLKLPPSELACGLFEFTKRPI
jgi:Caenorhabditis protein of unknown function, DUF268